MRTFKDSNLPPSDSAAPRWGQKINPRIRDPEAKRLAILRMAAQLFNQHGFYETSLNDLAKRLHVTKPSLYYYVKSKDDILLQILHQAMAQIEPAIKSASKENNGLEMLRTFVTKYAHVLVGDFGKCLVVCGTIPLEVASRDQLAPSYRRIDRAVRKMMAKGVADGSIYPCDPKIASFALFGSLHWMTSWYREDGLSPEELAAQIFSIFENGLRASGSTSKAPTPVLGTSVTKTPRHRRS